MKLAVPVLILGALIAMAPISGRALAQTSETTPEPAAPATPEGGAQEPAPTPPPAPPAPTTATIRVTVENVESDRGAIWVALCNTSLSVDGCPYQKKVPASVGTTEVTFTDIPPGVYAVAGYHDVNGNNIFDKILGVPREPYALSGAAGEKLVPTFKEAALEMNAGDNAVTIRMKRLGG